MSNYYLALGIERNADLDKIKKVYRYYCKQYHPDLSSEKDKRIHKCLYLYIMQGGSGSTRSKREVTLHIPAGVSDGIESTVPLDGIGLKNVFLHVDIIVEN